MRVKINQSEQDNVGRFVRSSLQGTVWRQYPEARSGSRSLEIFVRSCRRAHNLKSILSKVAPNKNNSTITHLITSPPLDNEILTYQLRDQGSYNSSQTRLSQLAKDTPSQQKYFGHGDNDCCSPRIRGLVSQSEIDELAGRRSCLFL